MSFFIPKYLDIFLTLYFEKWSNLPIFKIILFLLNNSSEFFNSLKSLIMSIFCSTLTTITSDIFSISLTISSSKPLFKSTNTMS